MAYVKRGNKQPVLKLSNIYKIFPGVLALDDINLEFYKGEIHGLVGKNGAGKSTLLSTMYGWNKPDKGEIAINKEGKNININFKNYSPVLAQKMGIFLVPQNPPFAENLSIMENFFLGNEQITALRLHNSAMRLKTIDLLSRFKVKNLSPETKLRNVSIEEKHILFLSYVFHLRPSSIILLDEVTSALNHKQVKFLFEQIGQLSQQGKTIIYVSHRLEEVLEICDRVTVFRNGKKIVTCNTSELCLDELSNLIVGSNVVKPVFFEGLDTRHEKGEEIPVLETRGLTLDNKYRDINFKVRKGEIFGIVGLMDSGVDPLLRTLGGLIKPDKGSIYIRGEKIEYLSPHNMLDNGVVFLSNDKEKESLFPELSTKDNCNITILDKLIRKVFISRIKDLKIFKDLAERVQLVYSTPDARVAYLSGGNKQKVALGRLMNQEPEVYILHEPTKGIDVGCKYELLRIFREYLSKKATIIMTSPSIEELILVADRILVLYEGRAQKIFNRPEFNEYKIFTCVQGKEEISR